MRLTTDRTDHFAIGPEQFWTRINRVSDYPSWWPWLHEFDGTQLRAGEVWHCAVHPPVPYVVTFTIDIDDVQEGRSVTASIGGDINGHASMSVRPDGSGCRVRLTADLSPAKQSLRVLSLAARPVVRFGHNWILDIGVRQFRTHC
jgi:hypothetical protein